MITRFATLTSRLTAYFAFLFVLAACGGGGGGGDGGGGFIPDDGSDDETYFLTLALYDAVGNPTNSISSTEPATLEVTVTRNGPNGNPVSDVVVSAETDAASVDPGTALTNAEGLATFTVNTEGELGAGSIEASVEAPSGTVSESINFQVTVADIRLGYFEGSQFNAGQIGLSSEVLPQNGMAVLTLSAVDQNGEPIDTVETVELSSICARSGDATLPGSVDLENGQATVEYTVTGCSGEDTVTATLANGSASASATITIASPQVNSIIFNSAEPELIALQGTGGGSGLQETSRVTFRVLDVNDNPIEGVAVGFSLSTGLGGVSLTSSSAVSDAEGLASTIVRSGDVATVVRVLATIEAEAPDGSTLTLTTVSDRLVVSTGLPDQNSISLSSEFLNVSGAREYDGREASINVRMADKFNNPVPDGTTALFTTEYGSIDSSCITENGVCSVIWRSQAPRLPTFNSDLVRQTNDFDYSCDGHSSLDAGPCPVFSETESGLGQIYGLRNTILVTAVGEEYFVDQNGNGVYDQGEPFDNLPEAFIDHNEDQRFTPVQGCSPSADNCQRAEAAGSEETFVDFNEDGEYSFNVSPENPNGVYNGVLCPEEGDGVYCSRELVNVRASINIILGSESGFDITLVNSSDNETGTLRQGSSYSLYIADIYNNRPPGGVTVSLSGSDVGAPDDAPEACEVVGQASYTVLDSQRLGAYVIGDIETTGNGTLTVTINSEGIESSETFSCTAPYEAP